jgi:hypothetical protein
MRSTIQSQVSPQCANSSSDTPELTTAERPLLLLYNYYMISSFTSPARSHVQIYCLAV